MISPKEGQSTDVPQVTLFILAILASTQHSNIGEHDNFFHLLPHAIAGIIRTLLLQSYVSKKAQNGRCK
jgi:hypothetical protein